MSLPLIGLIALVVCFFRLGDWPWDHDEVASLVETGSISLEVEGAPKDQTERISRLLPVWYNTQKFMLRFLPADEFGTRFLSAACGALTIISAFVIGWRAFNPLFAFALAIVLCMSQGFIWLAQQNRFYSMALLFEAWSLAALLWPQKSWRATSLFVTLSVLAVLCHNLLLVPYGIFLIASVAAKIIGAIDAKIVYRCLFSFITVAAIYAFYLRDILAGWISGGTGGTHPLVSYVSTLGVPTFALATLGAVFALSKGSKSNVWLWWAASFVGCVLFVAISSLFLKNWNPRYAILFMAPAWVLAAFAMSEIAQSLRTPFKQLAWYGCIVALLAPKFVSYWQDGCRHDLRSAANMIEKLDRDHKTVLCNWPLELQYYLLGTSIPVKGWWKSERPPSSDCYIVYASNVVEPVLQLDGYVCTPMAEIGARRFDEQSYWVRLYHLRADGHQ